MEEGGLGYGVWSTGKGTGGYERKSGVRVDKVGYGSGVRGCIWTEGTRGVCGDRGERGIEGGMSIIVMNRKIK